MKTSNLILTTILVFVLILVSTALFTIKQGQHSIVLRLGRLVIDPKTNACLVLGPGLHMKWPLLESVRIFDTRIQTLDIKSSRIVTKEKKDVMVDYYVKWKIEDLAQYFKATGGSAFKAETLLEQQLNTSLRAQFGKRTISDVVSGGRDDVMEVLRQRAERQASDLGVHVVDVRIKGIELPANTSNAIYQRMRADMQKIANHHRADGHAQAEAIAAEADAEVTILLATAQSDGQITRAEGQARAAEIYSAAFGKNKEFFAFYRSLRAYEESFSSKQDVLVLDQNSEFFNYFRSIPGGGRPKAS
jgi:membrane protease subunit HflC